MESQCKVRSLPRGGIIQRWLSPQLLTPLPAVCRQTAGQPWVSLICGPMMCGVHLAENNRNCEAQREVGSWHPTVLLGVVSHFCCSPATMVEIMGH